MVYGVHAEERNLEEVVGDERNGKVRSITCVSAESLVGRPLGNYLVDHFLEETKKTWFYQGRHPRLGIDIGLKVLRPGSSDDKAQCLNEEAYNLTRLKHSNIVRVYDIGTYEGLSFVVLELVKGRNLRKFLDELKASKKTISLYDILNTTSTTLDALDYARKEGIPHTDVKPENIMVKENGNLAGMVDFGYWDDSDRSRDDIGGTAGVLRELLIHSGEQKIPRTLEKIILRAEEGHYKTPKDFKKAIDRYKWWGEEVRVAPKVPLMTRRQVLAGGIVSLLALTGGSVAARVYIKHKNSIDYVVDQIRKTDVDDDNIKELYRELAKRNADQKIRWLAEERIPKDQFISVTRLQGEWIPIKPGGSTDGFWPGILLKAAHVTKDESFQQLARVWMDAMKFTEVDELTLNPLRFYYSHASAYNLTRDENFLRVGLKAADLVAARFNKKGGYLQLIGDLNESTTHRISVETMDSPVSLLCWASLHGREGLRNKIISHCDTCIQYNINEDGSCVQEVEFDTLSGKAIKGVLNNGYGPESCVSRSQARSMKGFLAAYETTQEPRFLEAAERCAAYFIHNLPMDRIPFYDFKDPHTDIPKDSSAAAIASTTLLDLFRVTSTQEYERQAYEILKSLSTNYLSTKKDYEGLLRHACMDKNSGYHLDCSLIHGDYYFMDALSKI